MSKVTLHKAAALLGTCKEDAKLCCGYVGDKAEETEVKKVPLFVFVFWIMLSSARVLSLMSC